MYHIGIVEHIISPSKKGVVSSDESVQAVVKMWDENLLILPVHKKLHKSIREGQFVLNDYRPMSAMSRHRNLVVIKILPDKDGKGIWDGFQKELDRRKSAMRRAQDTAPPPVRYIR